MAIKNFLDVKYRRTLPERTLDTSSLCENVPLGVRRLLCLYLVLKLVINLINAYLGPVQYEGALRWNFGCFQ